MSTHIHVYYGGRNSGKTAARDGDFLSAATWVSLGKKLFHEGKSESQMSDHVTIVCNSNGWQGKKAQALQATKAGYDTAAKEVRNLEAHRI